MTQEADDGETRLRNYLSKKSNPEANTIIDKIEDKPKKNTEHQNDEFNEYEVSDDMDADDTQW